MRASRPSRGSARAGNVFYGADNDGIGTSPYYQFDGNVITDEIKTAVQEAFDAMAKGTLIRASRRVSATRVRLTRAPEPSSRTSS